MNTEKQRQRRHDDVRLTESGNARNVQPLVMPQNLTNREWLPGELLSGLDLFPQDPPPHTHNVHI